MRGLLMSHVKHHFCSRVNSVRCFSSSDYSFSTPTRRERSNYTESSSNRSSGWQSRAPSGQEQYERQQYHQRQQHQRERQQQQQQHLTERFEHQFLVTCHPGLEKVTAADLEQCCSHAGITAGVEVTAPGRIAFGSDTLSAGYAAALHLRSATRVLQLIHEQQLDPSVAAGQTVYEATREAANWAELLQPQQTLGVHCLHFYNNSNVTNSQLVQRRVRDAVCDAVRDARGSRPAPPEGAPDLPLAFQMLNDRLQLFRDVGGGSLHRRGYRSDAAVHKAALNEAAAAGLLLLAGWQDACREGGSCCVDPMCGSGTLLIEAALIATSTAPGLLRDTRANPWPFLHWPDAQQQQWKQLLRAAQQAASEGKAAWKAGGGRILGNDCHQGALRLAEQAAKSAGVGGCISMHHGQCGDWQLPASVGQQPHSQLVVCNPPWGLRLLPAGGDRGQQPPGGQAGHSSRDSSRGGRHSSLESRDSRGGSMNSSELWASAAGNEEEEALADAWQQLSHFLKSQCPGAEAWVLSGNPELSRHLGMRASSKKAVRLGGQKAMWLQYNIRARE